MANGIEKYLVYNPLTFEHDEIVGHDPSRYGSMIYFLYLYIGEKRRVVYVGQTTRGYERIAEHEEKGQILFSDWDYIMVPFRLLDDVEKYYIQKFCPLFNYVLNPQYMLDETRYKISSKQFHHVSEYLREQIKRIMTEEKKNGRKEANGQT